MTSKTAAPARPRPAARAASLAAPRFEAAGFVATLAVPQPLQPLPGPRGARAASIAAGRRQPAA